MNLTDIGGRCLWCHSENNWKLLNTEADCSFKDNRGRWTEWSNYYKLKCTNNIEGEECGNVIEKVEECELEHVKDGE